MGDEMSYRLQKYPYNRIYNPNTILNNTYNHTHTHLHQNTGQGFLTLKPNIFYITLGISFTTFFSYYILIPTYVFF